MNDAGLFLCEVGICVQASKTSCQEEQVNIFDYLPGNIYMQKYSVAGGLMAASSMHSTDLEVCFVLSSGQKCSKEFICQLVRVQCLQSFKGRLHQTDLDVKFSEMSRGFLQFLAVQP